MKKKLILFVLFVCTFLFNITAYASSATTKITGTNTVKVGSTTKIYIKLDASSKIEGVDVTYSTSGNISVTNVTVGSGLTQISKSGNRYILYAQNPIKSGSTILTLTVKGTKEGTGTITVSKMEATVSDDTAYGGSKSYKITVNPAKTQAEIEKEKQEAAEKEEERKNAIKKATTLVEAAEKSLLQDDYDSAFKSVNALEDSTEKTKLLERLDEVKFKIAVKNECKCESSEIDTLKCDDNGDKNGSTAWILLCIVLFGCLVIESGYLIFKMTKKNDD